MGLEQAKAAAEGEGEGGRGRQERAETRDKRDAERQTAARVGRGRVSEGWEGHLGEPGKGAPRRHCCVGHLATPVSSCRPTDSQHRRSCQSGR
jgi:hypothetical protein